MAEKGHIKDIKDGSGGNVIDKGGNDLSFSQVYYNELCLGVSNLVLFDRVTDGDVDYAANVTRVNFGTIATINADGISGTVQEKAPNPSSPPGGVAATLNFYQPNLKQLGLQVGDQVKYTTILTLKGVQMAVNVSN
ncbi:MAG TPA: hypothetical protein VL651_04870 [Bacteroidia bacterium]|jgi:hypothetical protein|nr:hypothetical protein [Bacteroidia bacterium]